MLSIISLCAEKKNCKSINIVNRIKPLCNYQCRNGVRSIYLKLLTILSQKVGTNIKQRRYARNKSHNSIYSFTELWPLVLFGSVDGTLINFIKVNTYASILITYRKRLIYFTFDF